MQPARQGTGYNLLKLHNESPFLLGCFKLIRLIHGAVSDRQKSARKVTRYALLKPSKSSPYAKPIRLSPTHDVLSPQHI